MPRPCAYIKVGVAHLSTATRHVVEVKNPAEKAPSPILELQAQMDGVVYVDDLGEEAPVVRGTVYFAPDVGRVG